jgi:hypothetical protein
MGIGSKSRKLSARLVVRLGAGEKGMAAGLFGGLAEDDIVYVSTPKCDHGFTFDIADVEDDFRFD